MRPLGKVMLPTGLALVVDGARRRTAPNRDGHYQPGAHLQRPGWPVLKSQELARDSMRPHSSRRVSLGCTKTALPFTYRIKSIMLPPAFGASTIQARVISADVGRDFSQVMSPPAAHKMCPEGNHSFNHHIVSPKFGALSSNFCCREPARDWENAGVKWCASP